MGKIGFFSISRCFIRKGLSRFHYVAIISNWKLVKNSLVLFVNDICQVKLV